jgi:outer membrane immunogenic protein
MWWARGRHVRRESKPLARFNASSSVVFVLFVLLSFPSAASDRWTGPYVGLFAGYADANDAWDQGAAPGDPDLKPEGIEVGGFAGYGFESHGLALGVEADLSFPDFGDDETCGAGFDCDLDVQILSSLRGRAGVALGQVHLYGTGGLAFGVIQAEVGLPGGASESETLAGWTLGGGVEFATGLGARVGVEYRHSDYGSSGIAGVTGNDEVSLETDAFRVRLSIPLD